MGAERVFASRRESARSTPPVEPEVRSLRAQPRDLRLPGVRSDVQTAHLGERDNLAILRTLHGSWFRGIFVQAQMGPTPMVVGKIGFEQAVQVSFIEHDDMVQALTVDRTYQPFDVRRLPG